MAFNWWDSYYGAYVGVRIHGQIGKHYIFYCVQDRQLKRRYNVQHNLNHPNIIRTNENFRKAMNAWKALSGPQKTLWRARDQYDPTMSGYNYFISQYLKNFFGGTQ